MTQPPRIERPEGEPGEYLPVSAEALPGTRWVRWTLALGLLALAALFFVADVDELWSVLTHARGWLLTLPVACMLASYVAMARSYQGISQAAGCPVRLSEMLKITFVANSVNYLVATAGLSGFAVRMYFFTRLGIPSQTAIVISLAQTFLTNCALLVFLLVGFAYVLASGTLHGSALIVVTALLIVFSLAAVVAAALLFHARLRRRALFILAQVAHWVLHRLWPQRAPARTHIWRYQFNLNRGIGFLMARKRAMLGPLLYILLDWLCTILILHTAFFAVRYAIPVGRTIVGFAVGMLLSFASLIPGGLGVVEASMSAVFTSMQVPFETAVVAVLVFRVAYYVLPLLISLFFLHGMYLQGAALSRELAEHHAAER